MRTWCRLHRSWQAQGTPNYLKLGSWAGFHYITWFGPSDVITESLCLVADQWERPSLDCCSSQCELCALSVPGAAEWAADQARSWSPEEDANRVYPCLLLDAVYSQLAGLRCGRLRPFRISAQGTFLGVAFKLLKTFFFPLMLIEGQSSSLSLTIGL